MSDDPSDKELEAMFKNVLQKLIQGNQVNRTNYLLIFFFAGHGVLFEGSQAILLNEFDKRCGFYKMKKVEAKLRSLAETFPNSYVVGIFACCRQYYNPEKMRNKKGEAPKYFAKPVKEEVKT